MKNYNVNKIKEPQIYFKVVLVITILLLSIFVFRKDIFNGSDLEFHLNRIYEISENIKSGDFLSLVYSNTNGYGAGLFYPQIFLYIPALLVVCGVEIVTAYKIFIFICNIANVVVTYMCVKKLTNNKNIALFTSILYSTCCYRFAVTYWIAAVGTLQAFIFVPVVVLGIYEIIYRDYKKWYILAIGIVGLIYSHLISFVLVVLFICLPMFILNIKRILKNKGIIKSFLFAVILTILLTLAFVGPFLEQIIKYDFYLEKYNPKISMESYTVPFPFNIVGIYNSKYDELEQRYKFSEMGVGLIIFVLSTWFILNNRKNNEEKDKKSFLLILYILSFIYLCIMSISLIWKYTSILNMIQFPYRFQLINSFVFSLLAAYMLEVLLTKKTFKKELVFLVTSLSVVFNFVFVGRYIYKVENLTSDIEYLGNKGYGLEYIPASIEFVDFYQINSLPSSTSQVDYVFKKNQDIYVLEYTNNEMSENQIALPIYYYEGYSIINNSNKENKIINANGYVGIEVYGKDGKVEFKYEGTIILKICYIITSATYLAIIINVLLVKNTKKKVLNYKNITKI